MNVDFLFFSQRYVKRILVFLSILAVPLSISVAVAAELSREEAAKTISASLGYPKFETVAIEKRYTIDYERVKKWSGGQAAPGICVGYKGPRFADAKQVLHRLQERGLLTIGKEEVEGTNCITNFARIKLTKEGQKYLLKESDSEFNLRASDIVVGQVTGIVRPKGSASAMVEIRKPAESKPRFPTQ